MGRDRPRPLRAGRRVVTRGVVRIFGLAREHPAFTVLLALAAALRAVVQLAYPPALLFSDSVAYLSNAFHMEPLELRPVGYAAFLRPLLESHNLAVVAAVQHAMGLAIAVLIYATMLRLRTPRWLAVLAAVPVLFDAYQLDIEQYVMSDTLFEALLVAAFALLLWRGRRLGRAHIVLAGALLSLAVVTRFDGILAIVPALVFVLAVRRGGRAKVIGATALVVAFAAPLLIYAGWYDSAHGRFAITGSSGRFLYGHVAPFANCSSLSLPDDEKPLCPAEPLGQRHNVNWYVWDPSSPANTYQPPGSTSNNAALRDFAMRVVRHQPIDFAESAVANFFKGFRPTHATQPDDDIGGEPWQFGKELPPTGVNPAALVTRYGGASPHVVRPLGGFLDRYQDFAYTPGPLLAGCLLAGLLGGLGAWRSRRRDLAPGAMLLALAGVAVVLPADAVSLFSWRYQLPQLVLLPPAGALGVAVLLRSRRAAGDHRGFAERPTDHQSAAETERVIDGPAVRAK